MIQIECERLTLQLMHRAHVEQDVVLRNLIKEALAQQNVPLIQGELVGVLLRLPELLVALGDIQKLRLAHGLGCTVAAGGQSISPKGEA